MPLMISRWPAHSSDARWTGLLVLVLAAPSGPAGCQNHGPRDTQARPGPTAVEVPAVAAPTGAEPDPQPTVTPVKSGESVNFDVGGVSLTVTLADAEAIKAALLARLQQQPNIDDRDYLVKVTQQLSPSIRDGSVRVAGWNLQVNGDKLQLRFRMPPRQLAVPMYLATVERRGTDWVVVNISQGEILRR